MTQIQEVSLDELRHLFSERAFSGETMLLNMGPQHPSTHGVLRLLLELDGETVVNCVPDIGFLHTGIEKNMESKTYQKAEVMTDRMDYMNTVGNNFTYCLAIEKLVDLDVPPRAQAIRVILAELTRIQSHLVWLGTAALDVAAMSVFLYCFREREQILDIMELVSGQRMMTTYIRPGGVWRDVPVEFEAAVRDFLKIIPKRIDEYESMLTKNPLFLDRCLGIGVISGEEAINRGLTGATLRASGPNYDVRKFAPYSGYEQYDFDVPTRTEGDVYARYVVRIEEMRQTIRIIQQAMDKLPLGPVRSNNYKFVPPPRSEIGVSMESSFTISNYGRRASPHPRALSMSQPNRRAANWAVSSKATVARNHTASTSAPRRLTTCKSSRAYRKDTLSPTWSPSLVRLTLCWAILTDKSSNS